MDIYAAALPGCPRLSAAGREAHAGFDGLF